MSQKNDDKHKKKIDFDLSLGGLFNSLSGIIEKIGELADTGEELKKTEKFNASSKKEFKGVYGFTVKVGGLNGDEPKVEPFGNIKRDKANGKTVVQETHEPVVDVFEEDDHTLIIAELPGISLGDINLIVKDDILILEAEHGTKKYRKEILLEYPTSKNLVSWTCNNGVLEVKCVHSKS